MSALEAPRSPLCHLGYSVLCAVWLSRLCLPSPRASGCCVSVRSSRCHPSTLGGRYLLGGHCEPGVLVRSVMCVLMLLWGLLLCSFVPKMLPLCQSGVSGSVYFLSMCIFSLPLSVPAPSHHTCCIFWVFVGPSLPRDWQFPDPMTPFLPSDFASQFPWSHF